MASWRDQILKEFTPQVARLTLVADPDSLLTEENLLQEIQARGFELIPFEDRIVFRFAYESKYRDRNESGELTDLVIVLSSESHELHSLPYDLLQAGRQLSFSLKDLFPNLSYPIVKTSEPLETLLDVQSSRFQALQEKVDTAFLTWVMQRYGGLYNQPALKPVMLHQIPRFLARHL